MNEHIIVLLPKDLESLGNIRCLPGLQVATDDEAVWVRGISATQLTDVHLRAIPAKHSYTLDGKGNLFPAHQLTPVRTLPELEWLPIAEFIRPQMPVSAIPAKVDTKLAIRLVPSDQVEVGAAVLTTLAHWKAYAHQAPQIRLDQLRFAVSEFGQVLILGSPLPSIPGKEYWRRVQVLLPSGFDFELPLLADLVAHQLNPHADSLILFEASGAWELIPLDGLVPATRSAVRLSGLSTIDGHSAD